MAIVVLSPFDLGRPVDGWTGLHLRPLLLVTAALATVALVAARADVDRRVALAVAALAGAVALPSALSPEPTIGWAVTVRVAVLGVVFLAASVGVASPTARRWFVSALAAALLLASSIGLAVLVAGGDRWGSGLLLGSVSETRGVVRLTRPFSHANVAAFWLAPAVMVVAVESVEAPGRGRRRFLTVAAVAGAAALSLTLSRGGVLALSLVALSVVARSVRRPMAERSSTAASMPGSTPASTSAGWGEPLVRRLVVVVGVVVAVAVLSGRWWTRLDPSATPGRPPLSRPEIWGQAVDALLARPLVGIGPGRFGVHSRALTPADQAAAAHAHNPVLELLATGGLVAAIGLVILVVVVAARARPGWRRVPLGLSAAVVVAMLAMVVDDPFLFSSSGNLVALLTGAAFGAARAPDR